MGSALGIAVFGAIANAGLHVGVGGHGSSTASGVPASLLDPALHHVFLTAAVAAAGLVLAVLAMPRTPAPIAP
jgi:hypothetical protein